MDTIQFGLLLTAIPFVVIFQAITIWWTIADISVKRIKGAKRAFWVLLVVLLPPLGSLLYSILGRCGNIVSHHSPAPLEAY